MIVPMAKVQVLGPRSLLPDVLRFLQSEGVLQLRPPPTPPRGESPVHTIPAGPSETAAEAALVEAMRRIDELDARFAQPGRAPTSSEELPDPADAALLLRLSAIEGSLQALAERRVQLVDEQALVERHSRLLVALAPIHPSLRSGATPHTFGLVMREDPRALALLDEELRRITAGDFFFASQPLEDPARPRPSTAARELAVLLAVPEAQAHEVGALLFERGVEEIRLPPAYAGRPLVEALQLLLRRTREIPVEIAGVARERAQLAARWLAPLRATQRRAADRLERLRAITRCAETAHAFVVFGWVPRERLAALVEGARVAFVGQVTVEEHPIAEHEWSAVPVILRNRKWLQPFELLLSLVPLPRYGSIDPTPWLAVGFPVFFGVVVGDLGLGVVLLALALVARARRWGGPFLREALPIAIACAVSAMVFGLLFGEVFGELGEHLGLRPILFDRQRAFVPLLALAVGLGALHVLAGLGLGVLDAVRHHEPREVIQRAARLALLVLVGVLLATAAGWLPSPLLRVAAILVAVLLLAAIAAGGPLAPLDVVLALGHVLSYARLMALGLASVMLASAANRIATSVHPAALGLAIALVLHATNFTLGLLSPTVCALRLHYVEFFDNFYREGGDAWHPLALATKAPQA